ncbi:ankyrin repeat domain-containing protein 13D isoform X2 [Caretta caretta]|uniref:ankyrin repeat domain-containing protein 13D isoform X2 n=1 Tax=Caretta caretta TaxID=8467 RepID=UPI00209528D8|nr:ankyrin repeat domain-containing protein 13D isoform X2 [Caretta caretta]
MARAGDAFPLHLLAWHNRHQALESELRTGQHDIELIDPRGRTPLELAVSLGNLESARVLLRHNANVGRENANGWTVLQEAVSTGDPEMVQLVLQYRDYQRATNRLAGIPELLNKLRRAPDFYVEMKWEFTSWEEGAVVMEVDHDKQVVYTETLSLALHEPELMLAAMQPTEEHVASRLTSPIVSTHLDTKNIAFERNKSGIWGWRSEKMEVISGYEAKVYSASNVELITKTRTEHLSDQDKSRTKGSKTPFQSFLGIAQQHASHNGAPVLQSATLTNPTAITPEEYFDPSFNLEARNIGRPIEMSNKVQRFKATLWLCEDHPLSLVEQVTPIIDLMAISNAHFAKLRDFITLKLPPGFPVKIEIPLFHVLNARITFSNLCGCDESLSSVRVCGPAPSSSPGDAREPAAGAEAPPNPKVFPFPCEVDPVVFEVPQGYAMLGAGRNEPMRDEDDDLLQFAIQQSLLDAGTETDQVTIWEALTNTRPGSNPPSYDEELQLERAIQESIFLQSGQGLAAAESGGGGNGNNSIVPLEDSLAPSTNGSSSSALPPPAYPSFDEQLRLAMELSSREQEEQERRRREEDEELQRILQLSLTEK